VLGNDNPMWEGEMSEVGEFMATGRQAVDPSSGNREVPAGRLQSRLDRRTAIVLAVLMPLGPACVAALRGVMPTFSSDNGIGVAQAVAAAPGRQSAVVWLGYAAVLMLVPGVLAAAQLTRRAAPLLTWWAMALLVPAYLMLGGIVGGDALAWSAHDAGLGLGNAGQLYDHQHPAVIVATVIFVIGHVVGTVLLGLALLRSRRVPAAFAWALTISQPLHFVAFVILGVQPLDVVAWCLTVVGMGAAAVSLVREIPATPTVRPANAHTQVGVQA
jgi:hypothetical protein